jgi:uncharacterized protein YecT (DUF1311 family)
MRIELLARAGLFWLAGLVVAGTAGAQTQREIDARQSPGFRTCMASGDAAQGITSSMMDCLGTEIDLQDARLNQAYKMVMMRLGPAAKTRLRASERTWIKARNVDCKRSAARDGGGTASALGYNSCILDATIKRTIWLERYRG